MFTLFTGLGWLAGCRESDAESFHHEVENLAWEESSRGCAENTYLALFEVSTWGFSTGGML